MERYAYSGIFVEYNKLLVSYIVIKPKTKANFLPTSETHLQIMYKILLLFFVSCVD